MSADFRRLLEEADGDFVACRLFELLEADRGGEARGAAAHNDHVVLHAVALDRFLLSINRAGEVPRRGWRAGALGDSEGPSTMAQARRRSASAEQHSGRPHGSCCATDCVPGASQDSADAGY